MERIGTVETLCRYPVKSMAGEEVALAFVGFAGLMGDRALAFVRAPGRMVSSRTKAHELARLLSWIWKAERLAAVINA